MIGRWLARQLWPHGVRCVWRCPPWHRWCYCLPGHQQRDCPVHGRAERRHGDTPAD